MSWTKKAPRAKSIHERLSLSRVIEEALKYEIAEIIEATKASKTKKCPICPGNKCSPSNFM